ncbi:ABCB family ABC transporter ATP-binding protein/permease [Thalassotalea euphylliae]|uniref:ABC transporter ATP-binding protein/permease n=1 Tax=Thalassotalea euphylliae TaxID=1655234 RepID=A0A3E0U0F7_9GAMM|nr:ABC transporter ATP-binding protein/permease [Thalassotalea euphylliae]REL29695.1 ABC transporter ATP-binding protein/permease [Thalassotalea euphylliae]
MPRRSHHPDHEVTEINWRVLKTLWPYLLEFRTRISIAIACLILTKIASVYLPFILKDLVDTLDQNNKQSLLLVPLGLVAAYGLVRFSIVIFAEIRDTLFGRVTERAIRRIGLKVFQHLHQLELDFHLNRQTGGLSRDIDRGTSGISFLMRFMVFNIVPTLFEIALVIGILGYNYGLTFSLAVLTSIVCYVGYSVKATEWRTRYIREANKADSSSNTRAIDSLLNYETVKYFTNERYEANAYDEQLATWEQAKIKNRLSLFALNGGQALIIAISMTGMLAMAAYQVTHLQMTLGDFVLINAFMMQLFLPLNFLGFVYREIKGSMANIEHMFSLLAKTPKVVDSEDAKPLEVSEGVISFNNVGFSYDGKRDVIKALNFTIAPGQKVAVVGDSGSGKSTLVKLLFRFYDTTCGNVAIDGQDIREVTQHSLRAHIGIVPQDTVLFNDTLLANVHYGDPQASTSQVREAIKLAHLDQFIASLPDGENTMVGERGLKLSGGEKQRVAIARTILKAPEILVFDEATSSLDSHSEQAILKAIKQVSRNKTSLVIAHRLSTIVDADHIIVMKQGKLIEQGDHHTLMAKGGQYASMWALQQSE